MHQDTKVLAKGVGINAVGTVFRSARGLSYLAIVHWFGASAFGVYALSWAFVEMVSKFATVGCDQANIRFVAQGEMGVLRYTLRIVGWASALVFALVFATAPWVATWLIKDAEATTALRVLSFSLPCIAITSVLLGALKGLKLVQYEMWLRSVAEPVAFLCFTGVFYFVQRNLLGVVWAHTLAWLLIMVLGFYFAAKHGLLRHAALTADTPVAQRVRRFIRPLPWYDMFQFLLGKKDLFLIGALLDPMAVSLFAVANEVATSTNKIRQSFEPIMAPMIAELHHEGDMPRLQAHYRTVFRWGLLLYLMYMAGLWIVSAPILRLFGDQFVVAQSTLIVLALAYSTQGIFLPAETSLVMGGRSLLNLFDTIGLLAVNIGANCWLIPRYGIWGAAFGTFAAIAVVSLLRVGQVYSLYRKHPFDRSTWKLLTASLLAMLCVALVARWVPTWWPLFLILWLVTFFSAWWLLKIEHEEMRLLQSLWTRIAGFPAFRQAGREKQS